MENRKNKKRYIAELSVFICILASFYYRPIALIGLFIGCVYIVGTNTTNSLCILFFVLPFAQVFKLSISSTSLFTLLEFIFVGKYLINNRNLKTTYILYVVGFTFFVFWDSVLGDNIDILKTLKMFMSLSLLSFFINEYRENDLKYYTESYCQGLIISSFLGLFKKNIPGMAVLYTDFNTQFIAGERIVRFSATFRDPNYYAIAVIVALGTTICLFAREGINFKRCLYIIMLSIFGFTTYSKSYILMFVLIVLIFFIVIAKNKKYSIIIFSATVLVWLVLSGVLKNNRVINTILTRFDSSNNIDSVTSGRTSIWISYMTYIKSNMRVYLFGDGIGAPYLGGAAHNMYVETWYYVGIVGMLLFFATLIGIFSQRKLVKKRTVINWYLIIIVFSMYAFLCGFTGFEFPFYMMFCWVVFNSQLSKGYGV